MKKQDIFKLLVSLTPEEILNFIKQNGKEPKLIRPVIFRTKNN